MLESQTLSVTAESKKRFHTDQVLTVAGAHLVHDVFSSFLAPLLPLLIEKLGFSLALAGSLSFFQRIPSVVNPFIGIFADRVDLRPLIILAPGVTAVAMSLLGVAPSYAVLALLLLAAGLSSAALHVPGPVLVAQVSGDRVGKGMSFWMTGGELARTLGPLFVVGAVSLLTLEGSWPMMAVGVAASVVIYVRIKDVAIRPPSQSHGSLRQTWRTMRRVLLPLGGIALLRAGMQAALTNFLPTYMTARGQSFESGGATLALLQLAGAAGAFATGTLSDRLGRRRILLASMSTAPLCMLAFVNAGGWLLVPLLVLVGLTFISSTPVVLAIVQEHAREHPATANGLYMGISFVISSVSPTLLGWLADLTSLQTAFACAALLALAAVPLIYFLPREH